MSIICRSNEPSNYYDSLLKDSSSFLSYRIYEPGKSNYANNLITMNLTKLIQLHVVKTACKKNREVRLFKTLRNNLLQKFMLE